MGLRASELCAHFEHSIGSAAFDISSTLSFVNQAGGWLLSSHSWRFLERPPYRLNLRGTVAITAATWTESTLTLTVTSPTTAFADYVHLEGDQVEITAGTGATLGYYDVMSATASALVLRSSIGAAADTETDIAGTLALPAARLPSDIQELISVRSNDGAFASPSGLNDYRENVSAGGYYIGAIVWGQSTGADGGAPVPRLELSNAPSANVGFSVMIHYRAGWQRLTEDSQISNTPDWFDSLLIQAVRAYATGLDKDTMDEQLGRVKTSAMYDDARRRDGGIQRRLGPMRGGAVASRRGQGDPRVGPWLIDIP